MQVLNRRKLLSTPLLLSLAVLSIFLSLIVVMFPSTVEAATPGTKNTLVLKNGTFSSPNASENKAYKNLKSVTVSNMAGNTKGSPSFKSGLVTFDRSTAVKFPVSAVNSNSKIVADYNSAGWLYGESVGMRVTFSNFKIPSKVHNNNWIWSLSYPSTGYKPPWVVPGGNNFVTDSKKFSPELLIAPDSYFGFYFIFIESMDVTYEFYKNNTFTAKNKLTLTKDKYNYTFLTFDSLNGLNDGPDKNDYQVPDKKTSEWVHYMNVTPSLVDGSNITSYTTTLTKNLKAWGGKMGGKFEDERDSPTYFKNSASFLAKDSTTHKFSVGAGNSSAWMTLSSNNFSKTAQPEPPAPPTDPNKTVDKTTASNGDTVTYTMTQTIPTLTETADEIAFTDTVPSELSVSKVTVTIPGLANPVATITGNTVSFKLSKTTLQKSFGKSLKVVIETKVSNLPSAATYAKSSIELKNKATFSITQDSFLHTKTTPETVTKVNKHTVKVIHYFNEKASTDTSGHLATDTTSYWKGSTYTATPRTDLKYSAAAKYIPTVEKSTGTVTGDITVYIPYKINRYKVTVIHYRNDLGYNHANGVLATDTKEYVEGESYTASVRTNLWKVTNEVKWYAMNAGSTGTVTKNVTIYIPYEIYTADISIGELIINTNKGANNLSSQVTGSATVGKHTAYHDKVKVKISIVDQNNNRSLWSETVGLNGLPKNKSISLKTSSWSYGKDANIPVEVKIDVVENPGFIEISETWLKSYGFTSAEPSITNADFSNGRATVRFPIQTIRKGTNPVEVKYETFDITFNPRAEAKGGYGLSEDFKLVYTNDLNQRFNFDTYFTFDQKLQAKNSVVSYDTVGDKKKSPLVLSDVQSTNKQTITYKYPPVRLEAKTGTVTEDTPAGRAKINQSGSISGGNQFYLPVWLDLGLYKLNYGFTGGQVGGNHVSLNVERTIDVYAHMIAHKDSESIKYDELLLKPIFR